MQQHASDEVAPPKLDVLGTPISRAHLADVVAFAENFFEVRAHAPAATIHLCNVHSVMSARQDPALAKCFADGDINAPDGMPLVWFIRSQGFAQRRTPGRELIEAILQESDTHDWKHFFYGSTETTLVKLRENLRRRFPKLKIAGTYAPPFGTKPLSERAADLALIRESGANFVWVGLGMPKQELWMRAVRASLPGKVLVGIGAAFDFLAGTQPVAPPWMQQTGLEWLHRLSNEPRRLWRRYAWNNPTFLALWLRELSARRMRPTS